MGIAHHCTLVFAQTLKYQGFKLKVEVEVNVFELTGFNSAIVIWRVYCLIICRISAWGHSILNNLQTDIDHLYVTHQQTLISILRRIVGCHQTAEDLAQEAYLKVSRAAKNRSIDYPQPFLYQTAKNLALDYLRKQKVRDRNLEDQVGDVVCNQITDNAPTPDRETESSQELEELMKILAQQPERRRKMLILNKVYGWKHAEIAKHFGVSKSAVEKNIRIVLAHCLAVKSAIDNQ